MKAERFFGGEPVVVRQSAAIELLLRGRERVEAGWCQEWSHDDKVCSAAAIYPSDLTRPGAFSEAMFFLEQALPAPWPSIIPYNDDPTTTKADIISLYNRAIAFALCATMQIWMGPPRDMAVKAPKTPTERP